MDKKKLVEILKKHGLETTEAAATAIVKGVFNALPEIAEATPNPYDNMAIPFINMAKPIVLTFIDKINGEVG